MSTLKAAYLSTGGRAAGGVRDGGGASGAAEGGAKDGGGTGSAKNKNAISSGDWILRCQNITKIEHKVN